MRRIMGVLVAWLAIAGLLEASRVQGMPMFARKLDAPCSMCHTTIPRLNETGMQFRASGWRQLDEIGQEDKDVNNISTQNSARLQTRYDLSRTEDKNGIKSYKNQLTLHEVTLYPLTGAFHRNLASMFELSVAPEDFFEIENGYLRGDWKAGTGVFEGRIGVFHPFEGFGASDRPLSISRPLFQTLTARDAAHTFPFTPWGFDQSGIELGYTLNRTYVRGTLFNGIYYDTTEAKAFPAQGGELVKPTGRPSTGNKDFQVFLTQVLTSEGGGVSLFYYNGAVDLPGVATTFFQDQYWRAAGYASYPVVKRVLLLGGYQQGDDKYTIDGTGTTSTNKGVFGEADVTLPRNVAIAGRYDWFDPSDDVDRDRIQAFTLALNKPFDNGLQFITEYQHRDSEQGFRSPGVEFPNRKDDTFQIRAIWIW